MFKKITSKEMNEINMLVEGISNPQFETEDEEEWTAEFMRISRLPMTEGKTPSQECGDEMVTNSKTKRKVKAKSLPADQRREFMGKCLVRKGQKKHTAAQDKAKKDNDKATANSKALDDKIKSDPALMAKARQAFGKKS